MAEKKVKFYPIRCKVMYTGKKGTRYAEEGEEQKDEGATSRAPLKTEAEVLKKGQLGGNMLTEH